LARLSQSTLTLGLTHQLSAYDASYLELAIRRGLPLATQDRKLADAAVAAGIELLQP
jgi:predicted nucleic acid-binding protein